MATRRLRTLGDACRAGVVLEITCANATCGRVRLVPPLQLLALFSAEVSFATIGARLVCRGTDFAERGCGQRGAIVRYRFPDPPPPDAPPPNGGGNVLPFTRRRFAADEQSAPRPARRIARAGRRSEKGPSSRGALGASERPLIARKRRKTARYAELGPSR